MNLKGTKTEQNLMAAFAGESQARNKYTYFASVARKEGYEQIAAVFLETAEQEKEHAKLHLQALDGMKCFGLSTPGRIPAAIDRAPITFGASSRDSCTHSEASNAIPFWPSTR